MFAFLTVADVIACLLLIAVVLLQSGKAADLAGAFGGMGSQTVFGQRGSATVLSRATTAAAALFMLTSLTLSIMTMRGASMNGNLLDTRRAPVSQPASREIIVTPGVDGVKGTPQKLRVP
jgi:preprotein translocase subunit SecG